MNARMYRQQNRQRTHQEARRGLLLLLEQARGDAQLGGAVGEALDVAEALAEADVPEHGLLELLVGAEELAVDVQAGHLVRERAAERLQPVHERLAALELRAQRLHAHRLGREVLAPRLDDGVARGVERLHLPESRWERGAPLAPAWMFFSISGAYLTRGWRGRQMADSSAMYFGPNASGRKGPKKRSDTARKPYKTPQDKEIEKLKRELDDLRGKGKVKKGRGKFNKASPPASLDPTLQDALNKVPAHQVEQVVEESTAMLEEAAVADAPPAPMTDEQKAMLSFNSSVSCAHNVTSNNSSTMQGMEKLTISSLIRSAASSAFASS